MGNAQVPIGPGVKDPDLGPLASRQRQDRVRGIGAVWTTDLARAHRVAAQVDGGQIYVNTYGAGGGVELPFGGFRKSGYGRDKGVEALDAYTATKTIVVQL